MSYLKRRKSILEVTSRVTIDSIIEKQYENGNVYFIITVSRTSDRATREFYIVEDRYLIEKIIDIFFKGDEREEFDTKDLIGKEIVIDLKRSHSGYLNITNIKPVDKFECEGNEEDDNDYDEGSNLEEELFEEDNSYIKDDDLDFLDDIFDLDDDDLPSQNLRNMGGEDSHEYC